MSRRAQQGSVARCPYCEALLPQVASECPACQFPLTMAAAEGGYRAEPSGTTSTATPGGRSGASVLAGQAGAPRPRVHGSRVHRIRVTALVLAVTVVLLLVAGVAAVFTAASPDAQSDRQATTSLLLALNHAAAAPDHREAMAVPTVAADVASDGDQKVSVDQSNGLWFGAAKSISGSCLFLVGRTTDGALVGRNVLGRKDPCTGAQVRLRFEQLQARSKP